jgi:glycosyltransferase involved in cell wall biosynthesis
MTKITVALPVHNEEKAITRGVEALNDFLNKNIQDEWEIVIIDNASTDSTFQKAKDLSKKHLKIRCMHTKEKGRGQAIKKCWSESNADILTYMDIDLSTGLEDFTKLIEAIKNGYDISTGSRFIKGSKVERSLKRRVLSKGYNTILKIILNVGFLDAQCGFKAASKKTVNNIMPLVRDNEWFFDTELMFRAQKKGYRIKEIPVNWLEGHDSTVKTIETVLKYIKSVTMLKMESLKPKC